jgi:selenide, water dikinase
VGYRTHDDAGIYRLNSDIAIVTTADYITPPVADPFIFGQIAAANALSDVFAMGGRPVTCLNLVNFPSKKLPPQTLHDIIAGALTKINEAGAVLAGGHSIEDDEPKFGLAVTGVVHPDRYWINSGARPGDALVLTKPIGSGVLFNANLKKWVSDKAMQRCVESTTTLNRKAAETMQKFEIHAATDITGFGIAGHALEMAAGSDVQLRIEIDALPLLPEALEMYRKGMSTGMNRHNQRLVAGATLIQTALADWHEQILYDPQTSGGLLVALPVTQQGQLLNALHQRGISLACAIGEVLPFDGRYRLVFR